MEHTTHTSYVVIQNEWRQIMMWQLPYSNRSWGQALCIFCMFASMHLVCAFRYHMYMYIVHEFCINWAHYSMGICGSCSAQTGQETAKHKDRQWRIKHTNVKTENIRLVYRLVFTYFVWLNLVKSSGLNKHKGSQWRIIHTHVRAENIILRD